MAPAALGAEQALPAARYASWGRRAVAYTLDALIVFVALMLVIGALVGVTAAVGSTAAENVAIGVTLALVFVGPGVYYVYLVGNERGQTYGRRALGIQVRDSETYGPIGYGRSFGRYAIGFVFGLLTFPLIIDYLWPLWDGRNQTLHDKMVSSVVLDIRPGVREAASQGVRGPSRVDGGTCGDRRRRSRRRGSCGRPAWCGGEPHRGGFDQGWLGVRLRSDRRRRTRCGRRLRGLRLEARSARGPSSCSARPPWPLSLSAGSSFSATSRKRARETSCSPRLSPTSGCLPSAMMGAAGGAVIGGLVFLIWASRRVRKPEAAVDSAAPA